MDNGEIKFGKFDPCNVHVTVMTMLFADGEDASTDTEGTYHNFRLTQQTTVEHFYLFFDGTHV